MRRIAATAVSGERAVTAHALTEGSVRWLGLFLGVRGTRGAWRLVRCRVRRRWQALAIGVPAALLVVAGVAVPWFRPLPIVAVVATLPIGESPMGLGVNPLTGRVYVANLTSDSVSVLDGVRSQSLATLQGMPAPWSVGVNPATDRVYVGTLGDHAVVVLDGRDDRVVARVPVGPGPKGVAVDAEHNRVYVACLLADRVWVLDGASNAVLDTVAVGAMPEGIALDPGLQHVYLANSGASSLSVVDADSYRVLATVPVGAVPRGVGVDPGTHRVYVANYGDGTVAVLDGATGAPVATLPVGERPVGVAVDPASHRVYVTYTIAPPSSMADDVRVVARPLEGGRLAVLDGASASLLLTRTVGAEPLGVAVDDASHRVYVADYGGGALSILQDQQ